MIANSPEELRDRAKKMTCPQMLSIESYPFQYCIVERCMAWRERKLFESDGETLAGYSGWCGLAGEPHDE